jgi:hypothetical protein
MFFAPTATGPSVQRLPVPKSSEYPDFRRDHWAVGRPSVRVTCLPFNRCGQPVGESSHVSCRRRHRLSFPRGGEITVRRDLLRAMLGVPCGSTRAAPVKKSRLLEGGQVVALL